MNELFAGFEEVKAYIDDLLLITKGSWEDYLEKLEKVLVKLEKAGLKVNMGKSFFGQHELEYLGYWITRKGIMPLPNKVSAIHEIEPPKNKKQLRRFIGIINFYRDMWKRRAEKISSLTVLPSKKAKWK